MRLGVDVLASSARSAKMRWPFCAEVPIESTLGLGSRTRGHWFLHAFHVATILGAMILDGCTRRRTVELNVVGGNLHPRGDRKSTRLNSSHVAISYAVFCLKKKK